MNREPGPPTIALVYPQSAGGHAPAGPPACPAAAEAAASCRASVQLSEELVGSKTSCGRQFVWSSGAYQQSAAASSSSLTGWPTPTLSICCHSIAIGMDMPRLNLECSHRARRDWDAAGLKTVPAL